MTTVSSVSRHVVAGGLRALPLPSAEMDAAGRFYLVWADCRFTASCQASDVVMSTSTDGVSWSAVTRIPIEASPGTVDHFIPGLAVDRSTSGAAARLALAYHYYPTPNCSFETCQLLVGSVSSSDGGATWSGPTQLTASAMSLSWLPSTTQGYMTGDYTSASFVGTRAVAVLAVASAPDSTFHQSMYAATLP